MGFPLEAREAPHGRRKARNLGQVTKSTNPAHKHPRAASEARRAAFLMPKERRDELDANDLRNLAEVATEAYRDLTGSDDERTD